jgi:hypothetical protein
MHIDHPFHALSFVLILQFLFLYETGDILYLASSTYVSGLPRF